MASHYCSRDWVSDAVEGTLIRSRESAGFDFDEAIQDWQESGLDDEEIRERIRNILQHEDNDQNDADEKVLRDEQESEKVYAAEKARRDPGDIAKAIALFADNAERDLKDGRLDRHDTRVARAEVQMREAHKKLVDAGWNPTYRSDSRSVYYEKDGQKLRVSDHGVPDTPERRHNKEYGRDSWADSPNQVILPVDAWDALDAFIEPAPRRGIIGDMLTTGEVVQTSSGRHTTPFPKITRETTRKLPMTLRNAEEWLQSNALAEAESRGDDFKALQFRNETPGKLPKAVKDSMEKYLFNVPPQRIF